MQQWWRRKASKILSPGTSIFFTPVAAKASSVFGPTLLTFLEVLGCHIRQMNSEEKSFAYLMQHLSVAVQCGNTSSVMSTLGDGDNDGFGCLFNFSCFLVCLLLFVVFNLLLLLFLLYLLLCCGCCWAVLVIINIIIFFLFACSDCLYVVVSLCVTLLCLYLALFLLAPVLIVERFGRWSNKVSDIIRCVGHQQGQRLSISPAETTTYLFQRLADCFWRGNAAMWVKRIPIRPPEVDEIDTMITMLVDGLLFSSESKATGKAV